MSAFRNVETSVLIDILARNTMQLTELFINNDLGTDYQYYKLVIQDLQTELERRRITNFDEPVDQKQHGVSKMSGL